MACVCCTFRLLGALGFRPFVLQGSGTEDQDVRCYGSSWVSVYAFDFVPSGAPFVLLCFENTTKAQNIESLGKNDIWWKM
jgi:hypothetical protein